MRWIRSWTTEAAVRVLADRHYSRQQPGTRRFVPPGRALVLKTEDNKAYWSTSWPFAEYVHHRWGGAWICSAFRNENALGGTVRSSELIREAVAATRAFYGEPPALGFVTFVNAEMVRRKRDPGRCFLRAGFRKTPCVHCGGRKCAKCEWDGQARTETERLLVFDMPPEAMPEPMSALERQASLF